MRPSSLRIQRDRLRDLYESANTTEDVLAAEERLTDVQTEIERPEAQRQSFKDCVALSTVQVSLSERPPGLAQWYDTPILQAFSELVNGAPVALRTLAVVVTYAVPYLVVPGGFLAIFGSGVVFAGHAALGRLTS